MDFVERNGGKGVGKENFLLYANIDNESNSKSRPAATNYY